MPTPVVISNGQAVRVVPAPYALLREAVTELTRAVEDSTWTNLGEDQRRGDAPYEERKQLIERSRRVVRRHPLAKQAVKLLVNYTIGQGLTLRANDKSRVARLVDEFWEDPVNRAVLTSHPALCDTLKSCFSDGDLYIVLFPDRDNGKLQLGMLDALYVEDIISDPENWKVEKWYKVRKPNGRYDFTDGAWVPETTSDYVWYKDWRNEDDDEPPADKPKRGKRSHAFDRPEKVEDGLVMHVSINRRGLFGEPEPVAALDWLVEHRNFMEGRATINRAASEIAWRTKQKGTIASVTAEAARLRSRLTASAGGFDRNPPPAPGSHLFENDNSTTDWMRTDTGGSQALADERILRMMVGSGMGGIPNHIFGDEASANLATATAMGTPMHKSYEQWQTLLGDLLQDILTFLLEIAHEAGHIGPRDDSAKYDDRTEKAQDVLDKTPGQSALGGGPPAPKQLGAGAFAPGGGFREHGTAAAKGYDKYHPMRGQGTDGDTAKIVDHPGDEAHTPTVRRYMGDDGRWLPERVKLHDAYVKKVQAGVATTGEPTVWMTGGGPAAGKSTLLKSNLDMPYGKAALVNADTAKLDLPEYQQGVSEHFHGAAGMVHDEASHMAKRAVYESLRNGHDVIYDVNADQGLKNLTKKIEDMRASGMGSTKVYVDYVTIPLDEGLKRMLARAENAGQSDYGRYLPESVMRKMYADIPNTVRGAIDSNLFDRLRVWDNTVPKGSPPKLLATYEPGKGLTVADQAGWDKFMGGKQVTTKPDIPVREARYYPPVREHGDPSMPNYASDYHPGHGVSTGTATYHPPKGTAVPKGDPVKSLMQPLLESAKAAQPGVTAMLKEVAAAHGGEMVGLENVLKKPKSLERKIRTDMLKDPTLTPETAAAGINDALRYTMVVDADKYSAAYGDVLERLGQAGFEPLTIPKSFWDNHVGPPVIYQGVNAVLHGKPTDFAGPAGRFELQFHTPESWATKPQSEDLYKIYRDPGQPRDARRHAFKGMIELWSAVGQPLDWPDGHKVRDFG